MKKSDVLQLLPLVQPDEATAESFEPWEGSRPGKMLEDLPDIGWRAAKSAAASGRQSEIPKGPSFRWIRAAAAKIAGKGGKIAERKTIISAQRIQADRSVAALLKGCLLVEEASLERIGQLFGVESDVVVAFADLFFNVHDRRGERLYVISLTETESPRGLDVAVDRDPFDRCIFIGSMCRTIEQFMSIVAPAARSFEKEDLTEILHSHAVVETMEWLSRPSHREPSALPKLVEFGMRAATQADDVHSDDGMPTLSGIFRAEMERISQGYVEQANQKRYSTKGSP